MFQFPLAHLQDNQYSTISSAPDHILYIFYTRPPFKSMGQGPSVSSCATKGRVLRTRGSSKERGVVWRHSPLYNVNASSFSLLYENLISRRKAMWEGMVGLREKNVECQRVCMNLRIFLILIETFVHFNENKMRTRMQALRACDTLFILHCNGKLWVFWHNSATLSLSPCAPHHCLTKITTLTYIPFPLFPNARGSQILHGHGRHLLRGLSWQAMPEGAPWSLIQPPSWN